VSWVNDLSADDRSRWDTLVEHFRRDALEKISGSAAFMSIAPDGEGDVQFWAELGCAIMLGKPILVVVHGDRDVPEKLRRIADEVVRADLDTQEGQAEIGDAVERLLA